MMLSTHTTPAHLINRDLKRELRFICPGTHDLVRGIRVVHMDGEQSHLYAINGYTMDIECAADVISGYTPMPPLKKKANQKPRKAQPQKTRKPSPPKPKKKPVILPLDKLPMFKMLGAMQHAA